MKEPILLCRVAWMERYQGVRHGDKPQAQAKFIKENGFGAEIFNFEKVGGRVYGYPELNGRLNLGRLGADESVDSISGVTVLWCATSPKKGTYVVGWYKDATVYRDYDSVATPRGRSRLPNGEKCPWRITASARDAHLVALDDRWFKLPQEFVNQTMVRYLDEASPATTRLKDDLRSLVAGRPRPPSPRPGKARGQVDPQQKSRVEKAAIQRATAHFGRKGYVVHSVEAECCGWDLTATRATQELHIEVKGRSGPDAVIELTPNEYFQFKKREPNYRLCVVTSALGKPRLRVLFWSEEQQRWNDGDGVVGHVETREGATVSLE